MIIITIFSDELCPVQEMNSSLVGLGQPAKVAQIYLTKGYYTNRWSISSV